MQMYVDFLLYSVDRWSRNLWTQLYQCLALACRFSGWLLSISCQAELQEKAPKPRRYRLLSYPANHCEHNLAQIPQEKCCRNDPTKIYRRSEKHSNEPKEPCTAAGFSPLNFTLSVCFQHSANSRKRVSFWISPPQSEMSWRFSNTKRAVF